MAKGANKILRGTLLALGLKEYMKTATEEQTAAVLTSGIGLDAGESEGAEEKAKDTKDSKDAKDAKANDARQRLHDALDRMLDSKDDEQKALDEDMEQLKGLLGSEKSENASGKDAKEDKEDKEADDSDEDEDEDGEAEDEAVQSEASKPLSEAERSKSPAPSAVDGATVLKALKPFVAKSNDKRLRQAFDTASKLVHGCSKADKGGYREVIRAASGIGKDAQEQLDERARQQKIADEANAAYAKRRGVNKASN